MMPIGPLMIEHRLIERMIDVMKEELLLIEKERKVDPEFIESAGGFHPDLCRPMHMGKKRIFCSGTLEGRKLRMNTDERWRSWLRNISGAGGDRKTGGGEHEVCPGQPRCSIGHHGLYKNFVRLLSPTH